MHWKELKKEDCIYLVPHCLYTMCQGRVDEQPRHCPDSPGPGSWQQASVGAPPSLSQGRDQAQVCTALTPWNCPKKQKKEKIINVFLFLRKRLVLRNLNISFCSFSSGYWPLLGRRGKKPEWKSSHYSEKKFTAVKQFTAFLPRDREERIFWVQVPMEMIFSSELVSQRTCM